MIFVNSTDKSDFAAVDSKGNVYEENIEPYVFQPTGKHKQYIPCRETNHIKARKSYSFFVTEEKARPLKRIYSKIQKVTEGIPLWLSVCLPIIVLSILFYSAGLLYARTEDGNLISYLILAAVVVGLLPITKNKFVIKFMFTFCVLFILAYIPNYYFSRHMEKRKAVIEKIHVVNRRRALDTVKFRFENNDTFIVGYEVNEELTHVGDTCILDIGEGLWGMRVCRGVMCNGIQIWKY